MHVFVLISLRFAYKIPGPGNIMNLVTGYALTMSYLGLFQKNFKNIIQKLEECLPYVYVPMQPAPVTTIYTLQLLYL